MGKGELVSCSGNISEEEEASFLKKKWGFKENLYDFIYKSCQLVNFCLLPDVKTMKGF